MKAKRFLIALSLIIFIFIILGNTKSIDVGKKEEQNAIESSIIESKEEEKRQNYENEIPNIDESSKNIDEESQNEGKEVQDKNRKKKIELTDYVEFSIEEFIEKTRMPLLPKQGEKGVWNTADHTIRIKTDKDKIIYISMSWFEGNDEAKQLIESGEFPYTIAGICLNDEVENIESTILKNASKVSGEGYGYDYYTSPELSGLGIERMELIHLETVDGICVYFDMSLKENTENLEYIRSEKLYQAQKDKMMLEIKYPHLEIPGYSQLTQNINDLIIGAVEELEARINEDTDEDVIVNADYKITYMTSKFISITFRARVTDYASEKKVYQYCNIDITKNGEKAYLVNTGIRKEQILEACESWAAVPVDVETYINDYDTNWDQYYIAPEKYVFIVRVLNEDDCYYGVEWYK